MPSSSSYINSFPLNDLDVLFFNIFFKNNKLYLILPIYNEPYSTDDIKISIEKDNVSIPLQITTKFMKDTWEPSLIYVYDYNAMVSTIQVKVEYREHIHEYTLTHEITTPSLNCNVCLTTLFKDDYTLFPFFYNYYKKQGVGHFYMYYNGKITPEIREMFNRYISTNDVTLIEWDFIYWIDESRKCKYYHHAQMGQMHDALYRYGKDNCDYMIFCDLDEYLYIANNTILNYILQNNKSVDLIGFCNKWANTLDNTIPSKFPSKLFTSNTFHYGVRSKNIYKVTSINTIGIHSSRDFTKHNVIATVDLYMFHFFNWANADRLPKDNVQERCDKLQNVYL